MALLRNGSLASMVWAPLALMLLLPVAPAQGAQAPAAKVARHGKHPHPAAAKERAPVAEEVPPAEVPEQAAPKSPVATTHVAHEVPDATAEGEYEVPIAWVLSDGRLKHRPQVLSLDVGIWPDSFTLGAWWASPVLPRGFIRNVNDSLDVEFGLMLGAMRSDYYWNDASTSWQLWPAVGVKWNFFLTRNWTTFVALKLAGRIGLAGPSPGWFDILLGAGATYRISERAHLRLELNYPQGAVVGLSFPIGGL